MLGLSTGLVIACLALVFIGAVVQGSLGIGLGMISSPLLAFADTDFIPVAIVLSVIPLSGSVAWTERRHIDRRGLAITLAGRLPGVVVGAAVASLISGRILAILVAGSVLVAVVVSVVGRTFVAGDATLAVAGTTSGFMATTTGVGGPPMALTYQHGEPVVMRSTMSAFFSIGAVMSFAALTIAGEVGRRQVDLTLLILPAVIAGVLVSTRVKHRLDAHIVRPGVLGLCAVSAIALLIETFV